MATYIDGFVIPMPKKSLPSYKKMASEGKKTWLKFGALDYKECVMDDARPKGVVFSFPKMAKMKAGETVVFSYIVFKSRTHRDAVNKKVMAFFEKKYAGKDMPMPFDMKRFAFGGFTTIVE
jgi:uncharacterized protein YbaA (DUF1428 family)